MLRLISNRLAGLRVVLSQRYSTCGPSLKDIVRKKIADKQKEVKEFRKKHGKDKVCEVIVEQMYGGMRGIRSLVTETSLLDPQEGIRFRGKTIPECQKVLPKADCGEQPLPEGIFWLLLTGDVPSKEQVSKQS